MDKIIKQYQKKLKLRLDNPYEEVQLAAVKKPLLQHDISKIRHRKC